MKTISSQIYQVLIKGVLGLLSLALITSCNQAEEEVKPESGTHNSNKKRNSDLEKLQAFKNLQIIDSENQVRSNAREYAEPDDNFSFSDASTGYNYKVDKNGYEFTKASKTNYQKSQYGIRVSGSGFNQGGGNFVVGGQTFNLQHVFCATSQNSPFQFSGNNSIAEGFSMLIGVSGNIKEAKNNQNVNSSQYLKQVVYFIVYDEKANGSYPVFDFNDIWNNSGNQGQQNPSHLAYAIAIDYQNENFYISSEGKLNVNGSSITFSGKMMDWGLSFQHFNSGNNQNSSPIEVSASGSLSCSDK